MAQGKRLAVRGRPPRAPEPAGIKKKTLQEGLFLHSYSFVN